MGTWILTIVSSGAVNSWTQMLFEYLFPVWGGYIYIGAKLLCQGIISCLTFWGIDQIVFHSCYSILLSHQKNRKALIFLYPYQHLFYIFKCLPS